MSHEQVLRGQRLVVPSERSILDYLEEVGIPVPGSCDGTGRCGLCQVQIEKGRVTPLTDREVALLSPYQIQRQIRLACQTRTVDTAEICFSHNTDDFTWYTLRSEDHGEPRGSVLRPTSPRPGYGAAIDLGTSHIRMSLWDMRQEKRLNGLVGFNPQIRFGADVLTRLSYAAKCEENARELSYLVTEMISNGLSQLARNNGLERTAISKIVIAGNTAMLMLFSGHSDQPLLDPANWSRVIDCRPPEACYANWGLGRDAQVTFLQPMGGFVGSDLTSSVLATGMMNSADSALLVDFGTNTEIALWHDDHLWVTSAAGGPAFERSGATCCIPAQDGAIYRISSAPESEALSMSVIGDGTPLGLCGSGFVDLVHYLLSSGKVGRNGSFVRKGGANHFTLDPGGAALEVRARDIDSFQRAKAAIAAAIKCLMLRSGLAIDNLKRVCVCGDFGRHLSLEPAIAVGLLPDTATSLVELFGNSVLSGCELLLGSSDHRALEQIRHKTILVNMAEMPEYDGTFIENLYLQPMQLGSASFKERHINNEERASR